MNRIFSAAIAAIALGSMITAPAVAMPIQPYNVVLWDVPNSGQARGVASFQGLPKGVAVQVSLKAAGPGPDAAFIATGTCRAYKKLYTLTAVRKGLSNTTLPTANMVRLFKGNNVVVLPGLKYCGAVKSNYLR
jgi:hypothetical protein